MGQFEVDKSRERVVNKNLQTTVLPHMFDSYNNVEDLDRQKKGIDATVNHLSEKQNVDIKSQTDYINDVRKTFVLEIFSETMGDEDYNLGWFVNRDMKTDYYLFTWMPRVDLFNVEHAYNVIHYYPSNDIEELPDFMMSTSYDGKYIFEFTDIDNFCQEFYEIDRSKLLDSTHNNQFYTPSSIRTHHALLVKKERITRYLEDALGLSRRKLIEDARSLNQQEEDNLMYDDSKGVYSMYQTTSRGRENPINLILSYDLYKNLSDKILTFDRGQVDRRPLDELLSEDID